jgi:hypothetical protein
MLKWPSMYERTGLGATIAIFRHVGIAPYKATKLQDN